MTASYHYWTRRLAGEKIMGSVDSPQFGFFKSKQRDKSFLPLAIFADGDGIMGVVGIGANARVLRDDKLNHEWNFANSHVISEETYRHYEAHGEWPNSDPTTAKQQREAGKAKAAEPKEDARSPLFSQIAEAREGAKVYAKIEDDTTAAKAQELRSNLTTLAGKLDKEREALVRPHVDAQRDINGEFNPTIKAAKEDADKIRASLSAWETEKRRVAALAAEKAAKAAAEAEAKGKPAPSAPPPSNAPAPSEQIRGGSGRAAHVGTKRVVTAIDVMKVCEQFKTKQELIDWMTTYAQRAVSAGIVVEGATVEEVADVR